MESISFIKRERPAKHRRKNSTKALVLTTEGNSVKISIVIPAYNEGERITATLIDTFQYLDDKTAHDWSSYEVIVVSDGSTDSTTSIVNDLKTKHADLRLVQYKDNMGKGYALKQGMTATTGDFALFMDADEATPVSELAKLAAPLLAGDADIAIGSRSVSSSNITSKQPIHRQIVGRMFSLATRILLGMPFRDTQCGFKLFKGDVARELFSKSSCEGFAFDVEILANAVSRGCGIKEIGVIWHDQPGSKVNPVIHGAKMMKVVLTLAWKKRMG